MPKGDWESEVPELTKEQKKAQTHILSNLGRNREYKYVRSINIDFTYSVDTRVRDRNGRNVNSLTFGSSVDSSDS